MPCTRRLAISSCPLSTCLSASWWITSNAAMLHAWTQPHVYGEASENQAHTMLKRELQCADCYDLSDAVKEHERHQLFVPTFCLVGCKGSHSLNHTHKVKIMCKMVCLRRVP